MTTALLPPQDQCPIILTDVAVTERLRQERVKEISGFTDIPLRIVLTGQWPHYPLRGIQGD